MDSDLPACVVHRLGLVPYVDAWKLQETMAAEIAAGTRPPTLLLVEHPHIFTLGRRGESRNLIWDEAEQKRRGVSVQWVDRGGDVTYHGPGQLVGYPLLPLGPLGAGTPGVPVVDFIAYVRNLEKTIILTLARLGLAAGQIPGLTGVWVQADVASRCPRCDPKAREAPAKIASIGVKVDVRGVSRHGFALNVDPDMEYWQGIVPCGLENACMVSLADFFQPAPSMEAVMDIFEACFGAVFRFNMQHSVKIV